MTNISETLRLELSPFGVDVVTVMAGVVTSNFHANDINFDLPLNSGYAPIKSIIATWASGDAKPKGCSAEEFAEILVADVLDNGKTSGLVWRGPYAASLKFMTGWLPRFLMVRYSYSWLLDISLRLSYIHRIFLLFTKHSLV